MKSIKSFNGKGKFKNVFNLASYQRIIQKEFNLLYPLSSKIAKEHIDHPNILQLKGGSHYIFNYV